jgi:UDPglucose 6-dehydrogenase
MYKPALLFDGRNILDVKKISCFGFQIKGIGKAKN